MNWRGWAYGLLTESADVHAEVEDRIYAGGALVTSPEDAPFLVVRFMPSERLGPGRVVNRMQVWAHDRSKTYMRIDRILRLVRRVISEAPGQDAFICAVWEGDSDELTDDAMHTNTRWASFRLGAREDGA